MSKPTNINQDSIQLNHHPIPQSQQHQQQQSILATQTISLHPKSLHYISCALETPHLPQPPKSASSSSSSSSSTTTSTLSTPTSNNTHISHADSHHIPINQINAINSTRMLQLQSQLGINTSNLTSTDIDKTIPHLPTLQSIPLHITNQQLMMQVMSTMFGFNPSANVSTSTFSKHSSEIQTKQLQLLASNEYSILHSHPLLFLNSISNLHKRPHSSQLVTKLKQSQNCSSCSNCPNCIKDSSSYCPLCRNCPNCSTGRQNNNYYYPQQQPYNSSPISTPLYATPPNSIESQLTNPNVSITTPSNNTRTTQITSTSTTTTTPKLTFLQRLFRGMSSISSQSSVSPSSSTITTAHSSSQSLHQQHDSKQSYHSRFHNKHWASNNTNNTSSSSTGMDILHHFSDKLQYGTNKNDNSTTTGVYDNNMYQLGIIHTPQSIHQLHSSKKDKNEKQLQLHPKSTYATQSQSNNNQINNNSQINNNFTNSHTWGFLGTKTSLRFGNFGHFGHDLAPESLPNHPNTDHNDTNNHQQRFPVDITSNNNSQQDQSSNQLLLPNPSIFRRFCPFWFHYRSRQLQHLHELHQVPPSSSTSSTTTAATSINTNPSPWSIINLFSPPNQNNNNNTNNNNHQFNTNFEFHDNFQNQQEFESFEDFDPMYVNSLRQNGVLYPSPSRILQSIGILQNQNDATNEINNEPTTSNQINQSDQQTLNSFGDLPTTSQYYQPPNNPFIITPPVSSESSIFSRLNVNSYITLNDLQQLQQELNAHAYNHSIFDHFLHQSSSHGYDSTYFIDQNTKSLNLTNQKQQQQLQPLNDIITNPYYINYYNLSSSHQDQSSIDPNSILFSPNLILSPNTIHNQNHRDISSGSSHIIHRHQLHKFQLRDPFHRQSTQPEIANSLTLNFTMPNDVIQYKIKRQQENKHSFNSSTDSTTKSNAFIKIKKSKTPNSTFRFDSRVTTNRSNNNNDNDQHRSIGSTAAAFFLGLFGQTTQPQIPNNNNTNNNTPTPSPTTLSKLDMLKSPKTPSKMDKIDNGINDSWCEDVTTPEQTISRINTELLNVNFLPRSNDRTRSLLTAMSQKENSNLILLEPFFARLFSGKPSFISKSDGQAPTTPSKSLPQMTKSEKSYKMRIMLKHFQKLTAQRFLLPWCTILPNTINIPTSTNLQYKNNNQYQQHHRHQSSSSNWFHDMNSIDDTSNTNPNNNINNSSKLQQHYYNPSLIQTSEHLMEMKSLLESNELFIDLYAQDLYLAEFIKFAANGYEQIDTNQQCCYETKECQICPDQQQCTIPKRCKICITLKSQAQSVILPGLYDYLEFLNKFKHFLLYTSQKPFFNFSTSNSQSSLLNKVNNYNNNNSESQPFLQPISHNSLNFNENQINNTHNNNEDVIFTEFNQLLSEGDSWRYLFKPPAILPFYDHYYTRQQQQQQHDQQSQSIPSINQLSSSTESTSFQHSQQDVQIFFNKAIALGPNTIYRSSYALNNHQQQQQQQSLMSLSELNENDSEDENNNNNYRHSHQTLWSRYRSSYSQLSIEDLSLSLPQQHQRNLSTFSFDSISSPSLSQFGLNPIADLFAGDSNEITSHFSIPNPIDSYQQNNENDNYINIHYHNDTIFNRNNNNNDDDDDEKSDLRTARSITPLTLSTIKDGNKKYPNITPNSNISLTPTNYSDTTDVYSIETTINQIDESTPFQMFSLHDFVNHISTIKETSTDFQNSIISNRPPFSPPILSLSSSSSSTSSTSSNTQHQAQSSIHPSIQALLQDDFDIASVKLPTTEEIDQIYHRENALGCSHYERGCHIAATCCNRFFSCRYCHDASENHAIVRKNINQIVCSYCLLDLYQTEHHVSMLLYQLYEPCKKLFTSKLTKIDPEQIQQLQQSHDNNKNTIQQDFQRFSDDKTTSWSIIQRNAPSSSKVHNHTPSSGTSQPKVIPTQTANTYHSPSRLSNLQHHHQQQQHNRFNQKDQFTNIRNDMPLSDLVTIKNQFHSPLLSLSNSTNKPPQSTSSTNLSQQPQSSNFIEMSSIQSINNSSQTSSKFNNTSDHNDSISEANSIARNWSKIDEMDNGDGFLTHMIECVGDIILKTSLPPQSSSKNNKLKPNPFNNTSKSNNNSHSILTKQHTFSTQQQRPLSNTSISSFESINENISHNNIDEDISLIAEGETPSKNNNNRNIHDHSIYQLTTKQQIIERKVQNLLQDIIPDHAQIENHEMSIIICILSKIDRLVSKSHAIHTLFDFSTPFKPTINVSTTAPILPQLDELAINNNYQHMQPLNEVKPEQSPHQFDDFDQITLTSESSTEDFDFSSPIHHLSTQDDSNIDDESDFFHHSTTTPTSTFQHKYYNNIPLSVQHQQVDIHHIVTSPASHQQNMNKSNQLHGKKSLNLQQSTRSNKVQHFQQLSKYFPYLKKLRTYPQNQQQKFSKSIRKSSSQLKHKKKQHHNNVDINSISHSENSKRDQSQQLSIYYSKISQLQDRIVASLSYIRANIQYLKAFPGRTNNTDFSSQLQQYYNILLHPNHKEIKDTLNEAALLEVINNESISKPAEQTNNEIHESRTAIKPTPILTSTAATTPETKQSINQQQQQQLLTLPTAPIRNNTSIHSIQSIQPSISLTNNDSQVPSLQQTLSNLTNSILDQYNTTIDPLPKSKSKLSSKHQNNRSAIPSSSSLNLFNSSNNISNSEALLQTLALSNNVSVASFNGHETSNKSFLGYVADPTIPEPFKLPQIAISNSNSIPMGNTPNFHNNNVNNHHHDSTTHDSTTGDKDKNHNNQCEDDCEDDNDDDFDEPLPIPYLPPKAAISLKTSWHGNNAGYDITFLNNLSQYFLARCQYYLFFSILIIRPLKQLFIDVDLYIETLLAPKLKISPSTTTPIQQSLSSSSTFIKDLKPSVKKLKSTQSVKKIKIPLQSTQFAPHSSIQPTQLKLHSSNPQITSLPASNATRPTTATTTTTSSKFLPTLPTVSTSKHSSIFKPHRNQLSITPSLSKYKFSTNNNFNNVGFKSSQRRLTSPSQTITTKQTLQTPSSSSSSSLFPTTPLSTRSTLSPLSASIRPTDDIYAPNPYSLQIASFLEYQSTNLGNLYSFSIQLDEIFQQYATSILSKCQFNPLISSSPSSINSNPSTFKSSTNINNNNSANFSHILDGFEDFHDDMNHTNHINNIHSTNTNDMNFNLNSSSLTSTTSTTHNTIDQTTGITIFHYVDELHRIKSLQTNTQSTSSITSPRSSTSTTTTISTPITSPLLTTTSTTFTPSSSSTTTSSISNNTHQSNSKLKKQLSLGSSPQFKHESIITTSFDEVLSTKHKQPFDKPNSINLQSNSSTFSSDYNITEPINQPTSRYSILPTSLIPLLPSHHLSSTYQSYIDSFSPTTMGVKSTSTTDNNDEIDSNITKIPSIESIDKLFLHFYQPPSTTIALPHCTIQPPNNNNNVSTKLHSNDNSTTITTHTDDIDSHHNEIDDSTPTLHIINNSSTRSIRDANRSISIPNNNNITTNNNINYEHSTAHQPDHNQQQQQQQHKQELIFVTTPLISLPLSQPPNQSCSTCLRVLSRVYCDCCRLFDDKRGKAVTHCVQCSICRQGTSSALCHCLKCDVCYNKKTLRSWFAEGKSGNVYQRQQMIAARCGRIYASLKLSYPNDYDFTLTKGLDESELRLIIQERDYKIMSNLEFWEFTWLPPSVIDKLFFMCPFTPPTSPSSNNNTNNNCNNDVINDNHNNNNNTSITSQTSFDFNFTNNNNSIQSNSNITVSNTSDTNNNSDTGEIDINIQLGLIDNSYTFEFKREMILKYYPHLGQRNKEFASYSILQSYQQQHETSFPTIPLPNQNKLCLPKIPLMNHKETHPIYNPFLRIRAAMPTGKPFLLPTTLTPELQTQFIEIDDNLTYPHICITSIMSTSCFICLQPLSQGNVTISTLSCSHVLHSSCLKSMLTNQLSRCFCRKSISANPIYSQQIEQYLRSEPHGMKPNSKAMITCNDCQTTWTKLGYHITFNQCLNCTSYNTFIAQTFPSPSSSSTSPFL